MPRQKVDQEEEKSPSRVKHCKDTQVSNQSSLAETGSLGAMLVAVGRFKEETYYSGFILAVLRLRYALDLRSIWYN